MPYVCRNIMAVLDRNFVLLTIFNMKEKVKIIDLRMRGIEGLSSLEGIQIFWILL